MSFIPSIEQSLPELIRALPRRGEAIPIHSLSAPHCEVLFVTAPAGTGLELHVHDTDNVTVVVSGETILTTARGQERYGPGQWYETHAIEQHAVQFDVDTVQIELRFQVPADGDGRAPASASNP